ncbi:MAG TPA: histidine kinase dimerization/phospho-acceptor domain-containing protein [Burkholderiales bacterium]|jgi:signal transduction histidine kinase
MQDEKSLDFIAHELRNCLAPMSNALESLRLAGNDPPVVHAATGIMRRQVDGMARLVEELLRISRASRDKVI